MGKRASEKRLRQNSSEWKEHAQVAVSKSRAEEALELAVMQVELQQMARLSNPRQEFYSEADWASSILFFSEFEPEWEAEEDSIGRDMRLVKESTCRIFGLIAKTSRWLHEAVLRQASYIQFHCPWYKPGLSFAKGCVREARRVAISSAGRSDHDDSVDKAIAAWALNWCRSVAATCSTLPHLRQLGLQDCRFNLQCLDSVLDGLANTAIEILCLDGNPMAFENMPQPVVLKLGDLTCLQTLSLAKNCINASQLSNLAPAIASLKKLRSLCLDENRLGVQDDTSLLAPLPALWSNLKHLTMLDLTENSLQTHHVDAFVAPLLRQLPKLTWLSISENRVDRQGLSSIASAIHPEELRVMKLMQTWPRVDDQLDTEAAFTAITCLITRAPHLQVVDLSSNGHDIRLSGVPLQNRPHFFQASLLPLAKAVAVLPELRCLDYSCSGLEHDGLEYLSPALVESNRLVSLSLREIGFEGRNAMPGLVEGLAGLTSLVKLDLSGNEIDARGMKILSEGLGASKTLRHLTLSGCSHQTSYCETLAAWLETLQLYQLVFDGENVFVEETMPIVAPVLTKQASLQRLRMQLTPESIKHLAPHITKITSLWTLELMCPYDSVSEEKETDWPLFGEALRQLSRLRTLALEAVPLHNSGVQFIVKAIEHLPKLRDLTLAECGLGGIQARALAKHLGKAQCLRLLDLTRNKKLGPVEIFELLEPLEELVKRGLKRVILNGCSITMSNVIAPTCEPEPPRPDMSPTQKQRLYTRFGKLPELQKYAIYGLIINKPCSCEGFKFRRTLFTETLKNETLWKIQDHFDAGDEVVKVKSSRWLLDGLAPSGKVTWAEISDDLMEAMHLDPYYLSEDDDTDDLDGYLEQDHNSTMYFEEEASFESWDSHDSL